MFSRWGNCEPATLGFGSINSLSHKFDELQVNVYPNYPQVTLFGKENLPKLSMNNANLKENSGMFGRNFFF